MKALAFCSESALIEQARKKGIEVIYVRHKSDSLVPGTKDWQIHEAVAPKEGEKIIEKTYPSSFKDTDFDTYLKDKGIDNLIIVGMQVEYCVDTTIRVAFEKNYKITVPQGGRRPLIRRICRRRISVFIMKKSGTVFSDGYCL